jgi:hypothetical protein
MRILKLIILSVLLIILLLPTSCSTWFAINDFVGKDSYLNKDYANSSYFKNNDEVGYYKEWCKKNNYGGRKLGTDEEKLSNCIDAELRTQGIAYAFGEFNNIIALILLPIFLIYLYLYAKWLRRNYLKKNEKSL